MNSELRKHLNGNDDKVELWEFWVRILIAIAVSIFAIVAAIGLGPFGIIFPVPVQNLRDLAILLPLYVVLAIRREKSCCIFCIKFLLFLILFILWYVVAVGLDQSWSLVFVLATVLTGLAAPFVEGRSIFIWQAWPKLTKLAEPPTTKHQEFLLLMAVAFVAGWLQSRRRSTTTRSRETACRS